MSFHTDSYPYTAAEGGGNDYYGDPTIHQKRNWFSTTPGGTVNPVTGESYDYCEYCYHNFKKYNECVNNICQSCGRPADFLTRNKQDMIKIQALNEIPDEDINNKGVALVIEYPFLSNDETKEGRNASERMATNYGAGEAIRMIRDAERTIDRKSGQSFKVKTTVQDKKVEFDEKKA